MLRFKVLALDNDGTAVCIIKEELGQQIQMLPTIHLQAWC